MYGSELVEGEVDALQGVIAAIDGEKDPRCLLLSFQLSQQVIQTYEQLAPMVLTQPPQLLLYADNTAGPHCSYACRSSHAVIVLAVRITEQTKLAFAHGCHPM